MIFKMPYWVKVALWKLGKAWREKKWTFLGKEVWFTVMSQMEKIDLMQYHHKHYQNQGESLTNI